MKKLILLLTLAVTVATAHAQQVQKSPEERAKHVAKVLQRRLILTADQAAQVHAIYLTQATKMDSIRNNRSPDTRLNRLTIKTVLMSTHQHMMAILKDTQKQQYSDWENSLKERQKAKKDTVGAR